MVPLRNLLRLIIHELTLNTKWSQMETLSNQPLEPAEIIMQNNRRGKKAKYLYRTI